MTSFLSMRRIVERRAGALSLLAALVAVLLVFSGGEARAQAGACAAELPAGEFTEAERSAWRTICSSTSGYVDMSAGDSAGCDATGFDEWPASRQLSQKFFDTILFEEPYVNARKGELIDISCAWMAEPINLEYRHIEPALFINNSRFDAGLSLAYARAERTISFQGDRVEGDLNAERLRITDNFFIRSGTTVSGTTLLRGAQIGGNLEAGGSVYGATDDRRNTSLTVFNADSMVVHGSAFLSQGSEYHGEVRLVAAQFSRGLEMGGSTFHGRLNADSITVGATVFMVEAQFNDEVLFRASHINGGVEAGGSTFEGDVFIDRCDIGSSVFTRQAVFKRQANFVSTSIGESIEFGGADFQGPVNLESVNVVRSVFFNREVSFNSWVNLRYMDIGGNIVADGATFNDRLYGEGMKVRLNVQLRDDTKLNNGLVFNGAQIEGSLLLGGAEIGSSVELRNTKLAGDLDLSNARNDPMRGANLINGLEMPGAEIKGSVLLFGSSIDGRVNMTNAKINGELALSGHSGDPRWGPNSRMVLRNTEVGSLKARPAAWRLPPQGAETGGETSDETAVDEGKAGGGSDGADQGADQGAEAPVEIAPADGRGRPLSTDLSGFAYERESGLDQGEIADGDELVAWIESQQGPDGSPHDSNYNPQPYEQLSNALIREGRLEKAREIRYAKFEHYRRAATTPELRKLGMLGLKYLAGYGIYPILALGWFAGLVFLGWFFALASPGLKGRTSAEKFWYSFDNALPLVEMSEHNSKVIHEHDFIMSFFYIQRAFGLVLATALIGAVSLL